MKNLIILVVFVAISAAFGFLMDSGPATKAAYKNKSQTASKTGEQMPDFLWVSLDGKKNETSSLGGQPIVLNFWATWCAPCVYEFPQMVQLAQKNPDTIFLFVSVDAGVQEIERFLKKYGDEEHLKNVLVAHDPEKYISMDLFGTNKYPETFLISKNHKIMDKVIGADVDWLSDDMQQKITALKN